MKITLLLLAIVWSFSSLFAQNLDDVFNSSKTEMVFVGLDFSNVKMVGADGFNEPAKIQSYYFGVWNGLFISEMDKYDIKKAFMKREIDYDLSIVEDGNNNVEYIDMVTNSTPKSFTDELIQEAINNYNTDGVEAKLGISFVVHSFNKFEERAYIYIVIFDTKSKKVLLSDKLSGEAGGFGFRNYWAGAVHNIIEDITKSKFRKWKKENS